MSSEEYKKGNVVMYRGGVYFITAYLPHARLISLEGVVEHVRISDVSAVPDNYCKSFLNQLEVYE